MRKVSKSIIKNDREKKRISRVLSPVPQSYSKQWCFNSVNASSRVKVRSLSTYFSALAMGIARCNQVNSLHLSVIEIEKEWVGSSSCRSFFPGYSN